MNSYTDGFFSIDSQNGFLPIKSPLKVLPEKYIPKCGKSVQQIDPKNNEIIAVHNSIRDIVKKFQMSYSSLKKSSDSGIIHNGYKWKIIL